MTNPTDDNRQEKCDCNVCRLPDSWKKALDKHATVWNSCKESNDMGIEFGVPTLIKFVKAVKDEPLPTIKLNKKPLMKDIQKTANKIAKEEL